MRTDREDIGSEFYDEEFVRIFLGYKTIKVLRVIRGRSEKGAHPPARFVGYSWKYPKKSFASWVKKQT